jgi:hypothetical protein
MVVCGKNQREYTNGDRTTTRVSLRKQLRNANPFPHGGYSGSRPARMDQRERSVAGN